jgi:hypothetical protein
VRIGTGNLRSIGELVTTKGLAGNGCRNRATKRGLELALTGIARAIRYSAMAEHGPAVVRRVRRGRADRASAETRPARIEPEIPAAVLNREPTILVSVSCFFRSAPPAAGAAVDIVRQQRMRSGREFVLNVWDGKERILVREGVKGFRLHPLWLKFHNS